jgi:hypothetical protein
MTMNAAALLFGVRNAGKRMITARNNDQPKCSRMPKGPSRSDVDTTLPEGGVISQSTMRIRRA